MSYDALRAVMFGRPFIQIFPDLANVSDLVSAALIHQIGYKSDGQGWATATTADWAEMVCTSVATTRRTLTELVNRGWLRAEERSGSHLRTKSYSLVMDRIADALGAAQTPVDNRVDDGEHIEVLKTGVSTESRVGICSNRECPSAQTGSVDVLKPAVCSLKSLEDLKEEELPAQNKFALIDPPPVRVDNLPAVFKAGPVASAPKLWDVTHEAVIKSWPYTQTDPVTAAFTTEIMKVAKRSGQDPVTLVRVAECVMRLHGTTKLSALTKPARAALMARIDALAAVAHGHRPETIQKRWDALARNPDPRFPTEFGARLQRLIDQWDTDPTTTPTRTPNTASYRMAAIADKFRANTQNTEIIPMQQLSTRPRQ